MPTRNVSLTAEQDHFVARLVESGEYQNASEALRDGLRALQQRRREDAARLKALRAALVEGLDELDRGEFIEIDARSVRGYVHGLLPASAKRASAGNKRRRR